LIFEHSIKLLEQLALNRIYLGLQEAKPNVLSDFSSLQEIMPRKRGRKKTQVRHVVKQYDMLALSAIMLYSKHEKQVKTITGDGRNYNEGQTLAGLYFAPVVRAFCRSKKP